MRQAVYAGDLDRLIACGNRFRDEIANAEAILDRFIKPTNLEGFLAFESYTPRPEDVPQSAAPAAAGTWEDIVGNDALQQPLPVRKRVKIKDRGINVDSMQARILIFVTIDSDVPRLADVIQQATEVRPVTPEEAVEALL